MNFLNCVHNVLKLWTFVIDYFYEKIMAINQLVFEHEKCIFNHKILNHPKKAYDYRMIE